MTGGGWLRTVGLDLAEATDPDGYPLAIPAVRALRQPLPLHPAVTFLVGENGSGKSTLVEAIAVAAGFNPEGGSRNLVFETHPGTTSDLHRHIRLVRAPRRPSTGFFLRAESFFNVATQVERLGGEVRDAYGEVGLHEQSHGESFLSLVLHRFGPRGLYLLDEPEAALSPQGCLALLRRMHELVQAGGQFVVATHSPLLVAYPEATVYELSEVGLELLPFDETANVQLFRAFLADPLRFLHHVLHDG